MLRTLPSGHIGSRRGQAPTQNRAPLRCTVLHNKALKLTNASTDYARPDSASDASCGQASTSGACKTRQLSSRRLALLGLASTYLLSRSSSAFADEESNLPKEYRQLVRRLTEGLTDSIETEASGANEAEVRRKADPAKETVREFVRKWRDNPRVAGDLTHLEVKEALAELGEFYLAYGQRTPLSKPVRESVLRHLEAARAALPPEPERKGKGGGVLQGLL